MRTGLKNSAEILFFVGVLMGTVIPAHAAGKIINFEEPSQAGMAPPELQERPTRLLGKRAGRAEFESAAGWCRVSEVEYEGEMYSVLELPGGGRRGAIGAPQLPSHGQFIEVPDGSQPRLVVDKVDWVDLPGEFVVAPRQEPPADKPGEPSPPFRKDPDAYGRDAFVPEQPVWIEDQMRIRARQMVYVTYAPLSYNAVQGQIRAARRVKWHLEFDGETKPNGPSKPDKVGRREFQVIHGWALDATATEEELPQSEMDESELSSTNGADYLVITHDNFYSSMLPLAHWKHAKGYRTRVVRLSEISSNPTSTNITAYIQSAYMNWNPSPTYVLLVGDSSYLPACYKTYHSYYGSYAASDLQYATVDGTDYFPDLFVGRLPCTSTAECALMVQKILSVEKTPPRNAAMYRTFLTAGEFQDDTSNGYEDRLFVETAEAVKDFL